MSECQSERARRSREQASDVSDKQRAKQVSELLEPERAKRARKQEEASYFTESAKLIRYSFDTIGGECKEQTSRRYTPQQEA